MTFLREPGLGSLSHCLAGMSSKYKGLGCTASSCLPFQCEWRQDLVRGRKGGEGEAGWAARFQVIKSGCYVAAFMPFKGYLAFIANILKYHLIFSLTLFLE